MDVVEEIGDAARPRLAPGRRLPSSPTFLHHSSVTVSRVQSPPHLRPHLSPHLSLRSAPLFMTNNLFLANHDVAERERERADAESRSGGRAFGLQGRRLAATPRLSPGRREPRLACGQVQQVGSHKECTSLLASSPSSRVYNSI